MIDANAPGHTFVSYLDSGYVCKKCGAFAEHFDNVRRLIEYSACLEPSDPRCGETAQRINVAIAAYHKTGERMYIPVHEVDQPCCPISTPEERQEFENWLNSPDPIKALWGIE